MIDSITVTIISDGEEFNYLFNARELMMYKNGETKMINQNTIDLFLNYISFWDTEYKNDFIFDGEEFFITVEDATGIKKYHGKGAYPDNYEIVKGFLREL